MCTRECTTDRDRAGKMAVTKFVLVMMSPTISTAADLGLIWLFLNQSHHRKKTCLKFLYMCIKNMIVIVRIIND